MKRGTREGQTKWPLKFLLRLLVDVATFSNSVTKGRRGKNWSIVTSTMVAVYRDELGKKRVIDDYNANQSPGSTANSGPLLKE